MVLLPLYASLHVLLDQMFDSSLSIGVGPTNSSSIATYHATLTIHVFGIPIGNGPALSVGDW